MDSPQIKTITSSPTGQLSQTPPPLQPKKRYGLLIALTLLLIVGGAAVGWFGHQEFNSTVLDSNLTTQPLVAKPKPEVISENLYYFVNSFKNELNRAMLYRTSVGGTEPDQLVASLDSSNLGILGSYADPDTYVVYRGEPKLEIFDAKTGELELLFDIPVASTVRKVALSSDKKLLAYSLTTEGEDASSEVILYNLETKEQKVILAATPVGLYQGFSIEGWRNTDKQLVLSNLGGDAGQTWGEISLLTIEGSVVEKLEVAREAQAMDFLRGSLSPNGDLWLYQHCEQSTEPAGDGFLRGCPEGTELRTYNIATKQIKTVYRNLRYEDNTDKAILRTVMTMLWQDDKTVVVAVPGTALLLSVDGSAQAQELFSYDRTNPQNFQNSYLQLSHADESHIFYTRNEDAFIYDRNSKKTTGLNVSSRDESFSSWIF